MNNGYAFICEGCGTDSPPNDEQMSMWPDTCASCGDESDWGYQVCSDCGGPWNLMGCVRCAHSLKPERLNALNR